MTVCIAAICRYSYDGVPGHAIIAASDRMMTRGDTEYEMPQLKAARLGTRAIVLVAGEITAHTEAIRRTQMALRANPTDSVEHIASLYGDAFRLFRLRRAEYTFLSPLGLTAQKLTDGGAGSLTSELASYMMGHNVDAEAIIAGQDELGAHIHHVSPNGFVTCHDDIGFLSIGIGASHADSQFMSFKYSNVWGYVDTVLLAYSAKKRAEAAPGVGPETDMHFVGRDGIEPLDPRIKGKVEELYKTYVEKQRANAGEMAVGLTEWIRNELDPPRTPEAKSPLAGC
jgi:hypothetical protein